MSKLFDRLIDHVVDRVMARAQHNRPGYNFTVNNNMDPLLAGRRITFGVHGAAVAAQALSDQLDNQKRHGRTA